ncbi:MAG TPA: DUF6600 domain-containing protein [Fimbriimonas sp.]|nr:DUF6600 domain-containing protein [Fimbriimonas sp.]
MLRLHDLRGILAAGLLAAATAAISQDGYHVSEDYRPDAQTANDGPVRIARISYLKGSVSWRPDGDQSWADASMNLPLRQGAQIWVNQNSRAEIQFDDGSYMRIGSGGDGGLVTLQTLYSDAKGEFTEIALNSGLASLHLVNRDSLYQIDTETLTAKAYGYADFRVGQGNGVEVVDHSGAVAVENDHGKLTLRDQESVFAANENAVLSVANAPEKDRWDNFCDDRAESVSHRSTYLPQNIAIAAGNVDAYGSWHDVPSYGHVWVPVQERAWRPYGAGHWVWVSPFGWTWCGNEPWGWAPYHYGTWVSTSYGWGWVPGPAHQCWSPAVVHFSECDGKVAWCPLAPSEVRYAALKIGGHGWSLSFSIGSVGSYYPRGSRYCEPHVINNVVVNRVTNIYKVTVINENYGHYRSTNTHFVPINSRLANGGSCIATAEFAHGDHIVALERGRSTLFERGRSFTGEGGHHAFGPPNVRVTERSFVPTHAFGFTAPPSKVTERRILRRNLPPIMQSRPVSSVHYRNRGEITNSPRSGIVPSPRNETPKTPDHKVHYRSGGTRTDVDGNGIGHPHPSAPTHKNKGFGTYHEKANKQGQEPRGASNKGSFGTHHERNRHEVGRQSRPASPFGTNHERAGKKIDERRENSNRGSFGTKREGTNRHVERANTGSFRSSPLGGSNSSHRQDRSNKRRDEKNERKRRGN